MTLPGAPAVRRPTVPPFRALRRGQLLEVAAFGDSPLRPQPPPFAGRRRPLRRLHSPGPSGADGSRTGFWRRIAATASVIFAREKPGKQDAKVEWSRRKRTALRVGLWFAAFLGFGGNVLQFLASMQPYWHAVAQGVCAVETGIMYPVHLLLAFVRAAFLELVGAVGPGPQRDMIQLLAATTLVVPAIRRLKTSPIIGFLLMGVAMGPSGFNLISSLHSTHVFAELGIIFFLFEMGLELSVEKVIQMKNDVFGLGALQYVGTGVLVALIASIFMPSLSGSATVVLGGALALSSSAFVLQLLRDKGQLGSASGRASFGVLLFQDLAVVPLLVMVPLLGASGGGPGLLTALGEAAARGGLALGIIFVLGKTVLDRIFRLVVRSKSPEAFLAITLGTVLLSSGITEGLGLSNTLGAFFGGVLLSETKYRHQVEADIAPFRGMLLGLFFITVGFSIDLRLVASSWPVLIPLILGLMALKAGVVALSCRLAGFQPAATVQASALLAPGGEFAFVVFGLAENLGLLTTPQTRILVTATALSMALTPLMAKVGDHCASTLRSKSESRSTTTGIDDESMAIVEKARNAKSGFVVVVGYGRVGRVMCELLDIEGKDNYIVFDTNPSKTIPARARGLPVFLADVSNRDILKTFHVNEARLIVICIGKKTLATNVAKAIKSIYPEVNMVVRAEDDSHQYQLERSLGVDTVIPALPPDSAMLALPFGGEALKRLGYDSSEISSLLEEQRRELYMGKDIEMEEMASTVMEDVFTSFDRDGGGTISAEELKSFYHSLGRDFTVEEIDLMMERADEDKSGEISLEEFKALMKLQRDESKKD